MCACTIFLIHSPIQVILLWYGFIFFWAFRNFNGAHDITAVNGTKSETKCESFRLSIFPILTAWKIPYLESMTWHTPYNTQFQLHERINIYFFCAWLLWITCSGVLCVFFSTFVSSLFVDIGNWVPRNGF